MENRLAQTTDGDGDFELLAASLRADAGDLAHFVEALAAKLEDALPGRTRVQRRARRFLSKEKTVRRVEVDLGERRYALDSDGAGHCRAQRETAVRGIVLKSEPVGVDEWIDALARDLSAEAGRSDQARGALERLLS